ncbi:MAG: NVEALA domain-containing protein [Phocaeicola plebeius]
MKNNVLKLMFAAALAMVAVHNVYSSLQENAMTELELANVEALASGESGDGICRTNIDYTAYCNYYDIWDPCPCGF